MAKMAQAIGSGIDADGVLGVDGVNGSSSSSGGSVGGYENNFTNHGSTNNNTGGMTILIMAAQVVGV